MPVHRVFILLISVWAWSCQQPDADTAAPKGKAFYYYPSKNLYYDIARHQYIFSLDSGKTWDSIASKNIRIPAGGEKHLIYSDAEEVWTDNAAHIDEYHGVVLNIVNERSLRQPVAVSTPKLNSTKTDSTTAESPKKERKRPIKRFFEKLFGKKKSD